MKKSFLFVLLLSISMLHSFAQWKPAGDKIKTAWAEKINVNSVLPEYPRPIMERADWINLNGLWNYAIQKAGKAEPGCCVCCWCCLLDGEG